MKLNKLFAVFGLFALLSGCSFLGTRSSEEGYYPVTTGSAGYAQDSMMVSDYSEYEESSYKSSSIVDNGGFVEGVDQKIIKTGNLSLHVEDVRETADAVKATVLEWGGDVDSSSVTRYDNYYVGYLTIRVPSDQFDAAMTSLKEMAVYVDSEDTNAQNVTEAYMDLEARLTNFKAEEQQYLDILDRAVTVDETLQVTSALSNVRYQIESLEGQIKYYDSNVSYSTINLTLSEDASVSSTTETWKPLSTVREATSDWIVFLQGLVDRVIYLAIFTWPLLLIGFSYWMWRRSHGTRRK